MMAAMITQAQTSDKQQIEQLYREMYKAMVTKDTATLNRVHADDFILVHMTGMRQSKQQYIDAIADGTLNYYSATHEQMDIIIDNPDHSNNQAITQSSIQTATLTGRSRVTAAVFGGGRNTWSLQLRFKLRKQDGRWQFTESRASTY